MLRKSLGQQALKVFLSESAYGGRHQQFKAQSMSSEDYAAYLEKQDDISISIGDEDLPKIREIGENFVERTLQVIEAARYFFPHREVPDLLFAEDVFQPLIDVDRYNAALGKILGSPGTLSDQQETTLRKGGLEISHCTNPERAFEDPRIVDLEARYQAAAKQMNDVFGTPR